MQVLAELYCWKEPLFPEDSGPVGSDESAAAGQPPPPVVPADREWTVQNVSLNLKRTLCMSDFTIPAMPFLVPPPPLQLLDTTVFHISAFMPSNCMNYERGLSHEVLLSVSWY